MSTPHSVLTLPLICEPWQADRLDRLFASGCRMSNILTADRKKALTQLEDNKLWQRNEAAIASVKEQYKGYQGNKELEAERKAALAPFYLVKSKLLRDYGFSEYDFQARMKRFRSPFQRIVDANTGQKIASFVWQKFESYFWGWGEEIHFKRVVKFTHLEGKSNNAGFRYKDGFLFYKKMAIPVKMSKPDTYGYEKELLSRPICYCGITRRPSKDGWDYFLQLVAKGPPPLKRKEDGSLLYPLGKGFVGHDIGPQTLASVGEQSVSLVELARGTDTTHDRQVAVEQALARSRRATNPQFYKEDGTIIYRNRLNKDLLTSTGKRKWFKSNRYKRLEAQSRYLKAKHAAQVRASHIALANRLLSFGNHHIIEAMDWPALQERSEEPQGESGTKRRHGRSIANKAPGSFVSILEYKVRQQGGAFERVDCSKPRASQYDHTTQAYTRAPLDQRVKEIDGHTIQRDLYSAYLLQSWNSETEAYDQQALTDNFPAFIERHDSLISSMKGERYPSSMGLDSF